MKILGEKSLSSKVIKGLQVLFTIIILLDILVIISPFFIAQTNNGAIKIDGNLKEFIFILGVILLLFFTGIVALYIIYQFIKIFKNLKNNKLFEKDNAKSLYKIATSSFTISGLYLILLIAITIILNKIMDFEDLSNMLISIIIFVMFIGFLVFGIGIKILNEIYKKAIQYKEENDFTI